MPKINRIRTKLTLVNLNDNDCFIEPMQNIPRKEDLIDVGGMINEKNYTDKELDDEIWQEK